MSQNDQIKAIRAAFNCASVKITVSKQSEPILGEGKKKMSLCKMDYGSGSAKEVPYGTNVLIQASNEGDSVDANAVPLIISLFNDMGISDAEVCENNGKIGVELPFAKTPLEEKIYLEVAKTFQAGLLKAAPSAP